MERIGALSAGALEAVAKRAGGKPAHGDECDAVADGDEDVAERLMSVVRWRSRQQQQQQRAHQQADGAVVVTATDRAALLRALSVAVDRQGNEATALRLMVVVDVATQQQQQQQQHAAAAGDDLVSELARTIDGMDIDGKAKDAAEALIGGVVAHGTMDVLDALLDRLLGGESDGGRSARLVGTAMWHACQNGRVDVITQLLRRMAVMSSGDGGGVGVDVRNAAYDGSEWSKQCAGWTALHAAADAGELECVRVLLRYGADVNAVVVPQRADGGERVEHVGWNAFGLAADAQHGDVMDELLAVRGVRVVGEGTCDDDASAGWTALHMAVMWQGSADVATALAALTGAAADGGGDGVDARVTGGWADGYTALHLAAAVGGEAEVLQLEAAGADVDARVEDDGTGSRTALGVAAACGRVGVLRVLVELGADVNAHGRDSALAAAARCGREAAVALLLDMGAAIDLLGWYSHNALHRAMQYKRDAVARLLIARHADLNVTGTYGAHPMLLAIAVGNVAGVAMLCAAGADVNAADSDGSTALMLAAMTGRVEVVCELLRSGANVTARDVNGHDAMALASAEGQWDVVSVLAAHTQLLQAQLQRTPQQQQRQRQRQQQLLLLQHRRQQQRQQQQQQQRRQPRPAWR